MQRCVRERLYAGITECEAMHAQATCLLLVFSLVHCYQLWKNPVKLHSIAICPSNVNHSKWMGIQNGTKHPSRGRAQGGASGILGSLKQISHTELI